MDVHTITMDPDQAKEKLEAYQAGLRHRADEEWQAIAQGYEKLGEGVPLLNIADVFRHCPTDERARPRLAIARADRLQVQVTPLATGWQPGTLTGFSFDASSVGIHWSSRSTLLIDVQTAEREVARHRRGFALVPMVPPDVERRKTILRHRFVLWEVEEWADSSHIAQPDLDPYLLQHLGGDLYAVVGAWDLTELERAIMAGRAKG